MKTRRLLIALAAVCSLVLAAGAAGPVAVAQAPEWHWEGVSRVVAFGDSHGAHDRLVAALGADGILDAEGRWAGGTAHLVSLGDTVDRGPDSRKILDLLMRLEREAAAAGGRVHLVLGNHEMMNLIGDLRYVSVEEYRAFAAEESSEERDAARARYVAAHLGEGTPEAVVAAFEAGYPPGYFAHRAAFSAQGVYGSWLLRRPVLIRVDGTVFVHGGLPPVTAEMGGEELNRRALAGLREYIDATDELVRRGVLAPETPHKERYGAVVARLGQDGEKAGEPELAALARRFVAAADAFVLGGDGPLWYRGTAQNDEAEEGALLGRALAALGAERVAVGHTRTPDGRIRSRLDGRVLLVDTGMLKEVYRGRVALLVQEGGEIEAFYPEEGSREAPRVNPTAAAAPEVAPSAAAATEAPGPAELEQFLLTAEIVNVEEVGSGVTRPLRVTLRKDGAQRRAVFKSADTFTGNVSDPRSLASLNRTDRWTYDVAAYRIDRLIGLGMVPVAVRRAVQGREGALQAWVEDAIEERKRRAEGTGPADPALLERQFKQMYVFDVLIYNEDRHLGNILHTPADWKVHLIDHTRAFRTKSNRPEALRDVVLEPSPELAAAIAALDPKALREAMEGLLHPMQVTSILKRRDKMVEEWSAPAAAASGR